MEYILYISRFLYRIRWWLLLGTLFITIAACFLTAGIKGNYNVQATLYTGVVSGYSIESNTGNTDWAATQNAMDNLINIIKAESTLKNVSIRLFSRVLVKGNPDHDTNEVTAASYNYTYNHLRNSPHGKELVALINKSSETLTAENFIKYERPDKENYIYGLFYYMHPYYSYGALKNIQISRKGNSDLLEVNYASGDPCIAYNTISLLMEEFVKEYRVIRYGETDKVIDYFKSELTRIGRELRSHEDSLTQYNVDKRIINYYDETREIASINTEFELREQNALFAFNSSKVMMETLEKQMDINTRESINNIKLINKLKEASNLTGKIAEMETLGDKKSSGGESLKSYQQKLQDTRKELSNISDTYIGQKSSKEGIAKSSIVEQWLDQVLMFEKAKVELKIVQDSRHDLAERYAFFAPVGSTIKRQERTINFTEQNYLSLLQSYNDALMRKKSLEMTSATLKVLNPPAFPINTESTGRKKIVMAACAGSFLFILGFFLLLEMLDRTLRDSIRARRLTGLPVLGAFPTPSIMRFRGQNSACYTVATQYMSSAILRFCNQRENNSKPYQINILSCNNGDGKSFLVEQLKEYWNSIGLRVHVLTYGIDFDPNSRLFTLAQQIDDLYTPAGEDIVIIEFPSLNDTYVPSKLLRSAQLNLLVASAVRGWKENDKLLIERLVKQVETAPLFLYLNRANRNVVEDYTGMLPPYTFVRQQLYRLSQLALTEKMILKPYKANTGIDEDDD